MSGHRPWSEVRAEFAARPGAEEAIARRKRAMRAVLQLASVRDALGVTQVDLAEMLGVSQPNVSRIEHQENIELSTLAEYVRAMGGRLEINAVFPDRTIALLVAPEEESEGLPDLDPSPALASARD